MRLMCLNIWSGHETDALIDFFGCNWFETDVFCLQEVYQSISKKLEFIDYNYHIKRDIDEILNPYFQDHFRPFMEGCLFDGTPFDEDIRTGLCSYISRKLPENISFVEEGDVAIIGQRSHFSKDQINPRNLQYLSFYDHNAKKPFHILNFHGVWIPKHGKGNHEVRGQQTAKIIKFMSQLEGGIIICGDFNVNPDTDMIGYLEAFGFQNLIKNHKVTTTRTKLYGEEKMKNSPYADYVFATEEIQVNSFKVLPDIVSDHAPLYLDFSVV